MKAVYQLPIQLQDRLLEISLEHIRLAKEFALGRGSITPERKQQIWNRIEELRKERVAILQ